MKCAYPVCKEIIKLAQKCPKCKEISYCCTNCRAQDWYKTHKNVCTGLEANSKKNAYEDLGEVLGTGSYGEVRLVRQKTTSKQYAMKIINKKSVEQEASIEVIMREISVHKDLDHPNIVQLHDSYQDEQFIYIILEHAESGSLFQKINENKRLSEDQARKYFSQVLAGVIYLHDRQIVHRDIKPENILLDRNDNVKICDFGWCVKGEEPRSTFCGTLDYMAPEMIKGQQHSSEVDIWALGVLLYEFLHGYSPFESARDMDKCQKIVNCKFVFDESISENAKDLIQRMIQVQQDSRIKLREALAHPFFAASAGSEGEGKTGVVVGCSFRGYVQNYGMDDGVVEEIREGDCLVLFKKSGVRENMTFEEVDRRLKRAKLVGKKESAVDDRSRELEESKRIGKPGKGSGNVLKIVERFEGKSGEKRNHSVEVTKEVKGFGEKTSENVLKIAGRYESKGKMDEEFGNKMKMPVEKKKEEPSRNREEEVKASAPDRGKSNVLKMAERFEKKNIPAVAQPKEVRSQDKDESFAKKVEFVKKEVAFPKKENLSGKKEDSFSSKEQSFVNKEEVASKYEDSYEKKEVQKKGDTKSKKEEMIFKNQEPAKREEYNIKNQEPKMEEISVIRQDMPNKYEDSGPENEDPMALFNKRFAELAKEENDVSFSGTKHKADVAKPELNFKKPDLQFEERFPNSNFDTESINVTFSKDEIYLDDDKFTTIMVRPRDEPKLNKFETSLVRPNEEPRGNKRPPVMEDISGPKPESMAKDTSKEESIFNNLDNWIKAPARRKGGKRKTPVPDRSRDKSIEKSLEEFKEKFAVKPEAIPEKKPELFAEKKPPQIILQSENPQKIILKQASKPPLPVKNKEIDSDDDDDDEDSEEKRVSMNIYKQKILENIKKVNSEQSTEAKKLGIQHQKSRSKTPALMPFAIPNERPVEAKRNYTPKNKLNSANVFFMPEGEFYSDHSDSHQGAGERDVKSPCFDDRGDSNDEERPSYEITQTIHNKACNIFNEKEKASVLSNLRRSPSPDSLMKSSKKSSKEPERKGTKSKKMAPFFPNVKDFDPEPKQKSGGKNEKSGKKLNDYQTQREMIENQHEMYYNKLEEMWIDRQDDFIEAPDMSEHEVEDEHKVDFREYDMVLRNPPSVVSGIEDYDQNISKTNKKLNQRKKDLEAMINIIDKQNVRSVTRIKNQPKPKPKKQKEGLLQWIGGIIGCSDRY